ncbi:DUF2298 domain-containing protein [Acidobacteriota bacterium]
MDFIWACLFLLWNELLSLPLRALLSRINAPPDVRRILSRLAGPVLLILPVWLLGHSGSWALTRTFGLLWVALSVAGCMVVALRRGSLLKALGYERVAPKGQIASRGWLVDLFSTALFFGFVALRRWTPEMTFEIGASGAEKFPNAMFFWSCWFADGLPPQDYWLAGQPLTYYYFGHFHWAWIGRTAGFMAEIVITLALARLALAVFEAVYLMARTLKLSKTWSIITGLVTAWSGNPAGVAEFCRLWMTSHRQGVVLGWTGYDFWAPSRAIKHVVDEFPAFTAILGDFHAHHLALPWLLTWVAVIIAGLRWLRATSSDSSQARPSSSASPAAWLVLVLVWTSLGAVSIAANMWNLPLLVLAMGMAVLLLVRLRHPCRKRILGAMLLQGVLLLLVWVLIRGGTSIPLPSGSGEGSLGWFPLRPVPDYLRTDLKELFMMWGFPVLVIMAAFGSFIVRRTVNSLRTNQLKGIKRVEKILLAVVLIIFPFVTIQLPGKTAWLWAGIAVWLVLMAIAPRPWISKNAAVLAFASCLILSGLELFYLRDRYTGDLVRYNSYFKFSFPLWPVLYVVAFVLAERVWNSASSLKAGIPMRSGLILLLAAGFIYPICAIPARIHQARTDDLSDARPRLNTVDFTLNRYPWNAEAPVLEWIRSNVPPGDVVLEAAVDRVYAYNGRVASLAGRPVPVGWPHHEHQWRGDAVTALVSQRMEIVKRAYYAPSYQVLMQAVRDLDARWMLYGINEEKHYGPQVLRQLREIAPVAMQSPPDNPRFFVFELGGAVSVVPEDKAGGPDGGLSE